MGNAITPCLRANKSSIDKNKVKILIWGGTTRILRESQPATKLMIEFHDQLVCQANSFYIGRPAPILSIGDDLLLGQTYLVIPADRLTSNIITAASVASLSSGTNKSSKNKPIDFGENPFEFVKNERGETLIKVSPAFMEKIVLGNDREGKTDDNCNGGCDLFLCSTPELKKQYDQLVGSRTPSWSPKLETISEKERGRLSPMRLLGR